MAVSGMGGAASGDDVAELVTALQSALALVQGAVPTTRTVTAGTGLTGGGALSGNITIALADPQDGGSA